MLDIVKILGTKDSPAKKKILKQELEKMDPSIFPLQKGLAHSSQVSGNDFSVIVLRVDDALDELAVKAGIQYKGIVSGCSCADDPSPINEIDEYCDVKILINKKTAEINITLLED